MLKNSTEPQRPGQGEPLSEALERIQEALKSLRFGQVTIIVQDGVVVQVERTEKLRLSSKKKDREL